MKLSAKMEAALNEQLNFEFLSHYLYLSMASAMSSMRMAGGANWMRMQAQEEFEHGMKMFDFIESRDGRVILDGMPEPRREWASVLDIFQSALAHEELVTERFNKLVDLALEERDHSSNNLLQWFVGEQVEEESTLHDIIQRMEMIGEDGTGLYLMDRDLQTRQVSQV